MTKNEIVVRWINEEGVNFGVTDHNQVKLEDYNILHEAWVKFRDLKFDIGSHQLQIHEIKCKNIGIEILNHSITEAFDELLMGIEWYNSLNNKLGIK